MFNKNKPVIISLILTSSYLLAAGNPCDEREYCGRVVILSQGAGEESTSNSGQIRTYPNESIEFTKAFINDSLRKTPSLLISSDPGYRNSKEASTAVAVMGANSAGPYYSSRESLEKIEKDKYLEKIRQGFLAKENTACTELMLKHPGKDISEFIKVEYLISGHSYHDDTFKGFPIHSQDKKTSHIDDVTDFITSKEIANITKHFPNSTMQVISTTCDGEDAGDMVLSTLNENQCACYAVYSKSGALAPAGEAPIFREHVKLNSDKKGNYKGAESLSNFTLPSLNAYRWEITKVTKDTKNNRFISPIFAYDPSEPNPFNNYTFTSADLRADKILRNFTGEKDNLKIDYSKEEAALATAAIQSVAGTPVSEKAKAVFISNTTANDIVGDITVMLDKQKIEHGKIVDQYQRKPKDFSDYWSKARDFYYSCVKEPSPKTTCSVFSKFVFDAYKIQLQDNVNHQDEVELSTLGVKLKADVMTVASLDPKAVPESKEERNRIAQEKLKLINANPIAYLSEVKSAYDNFNQYRTNVLLVATKWFNAGKLSDTELGSINKTLDDYSEIMAGYYSSYLNAYFPDVVEALLDGRRTKIQTAAKLLLSKYQETKDSRILNELNALRNDLFCSNFIPVGPAFDIREIPKGSPNFAQGKHIKSAKRDENDQDSTEVIDPTRDENGQKLGPKDGSIR